MYKRSISLLCLAMVFFSLLVPAYAANIQAPDGFVNWSSEERAAWIAENVQPDLENLQPGIQTRSDEWLHATYNSRHYNVARVYLGSMYTHGKWMTDNNGNVSDYAPISISYYVSDNSITHHQTLNDDMYAYLPHPTTCRMTFETRVAHIPSATDYYYAHVYYLYGTGEYTISVVE